MMRMLRLGYHKLCTIVPAVENVILFFSILTP
jgi:hypothetical protein